MDFWFLIAEVMLLLASAFVLGAVAERLNQSAVLGYLLAGILMGPLLFNKAPVASVAELGVALLLFSIGLEFSLRRLRNMGAFALAGGSLQVMLTLALFAGIFKMGRPIAAAVSLGAMVALSSTAIVLRMLVDRAEVDSSRGRNALGILLLQDVAVVPLVLGVTMLGRGGNLGEMTLQVVRTIGAAAALVVAFYLLFYHLIPKLLQTTLFANRELVVLLTIVLAVGSTWSAHALGLSPALGAFLAGILLAESPFSVQVRSDIGSIRVLFVTLFFTSIGMLADPRWFFNNWLTVLLWLMLVFAGKTAIIYALGLLFGKGHRLALATGITLAQIGEFSFVLAAAAKSGGLISGHEFALMLSVTILSMFMGPYMVAYAEPIAALLVARYPGATKRVPTGGDGGERECSRRILVIGFGPAGQQVAARLQAEGVAPEVIELNPKSAAKAREKKLTVHMGDATADDVLAHAGVPDAGLVAVTVPDPRTAARIIASVRRMAPEAVIIARSRYHIACQQLQEVGADVTVDEEQTVGVNLANEIIKVLHQSNRDALACALAGERPQ